MEIKDLKKTFGTKTIFEGFQLAIEKGEFVIFSGVSGCGKTTLLNMIGSLEEYDSGQILYEGRDIGNKKVQRWYLREKVGFLFQNFALVEDKTVQDNLKMVRKDNRTKLRMEEALEKVGLSTAILQQKIYTLSGGEQQRVALARLMVKRSELILCDEPTGSLDRKNGERIMGILRQMNEEGKTIVMVTHDEAYKNYGGRIVEL